MNFSSNSLEPRFTKKIFLSILLIAFLLRIWGVQFGLPYPYHPDEVKYVLMALKMGHFGLNPHYFINPSVFTYILFILYGCYYVVGHLAGHFQSTLGFIQTFVTQPTSFYLIARLVTVFFSLLTIVIVYRIGKTLFDESTGLISSFLLSIVFIYVRDSHYGVPDITMICFLMIAYYFLVKCTLEGKMKHVYLAGFFIGLACATKYTAVFLFPIYILVLYRCKSKFNKNNIIYIMIKSSVISGFGFLIGCPYALIDFHSFWSDIHQLAFFGHTGWFGINTTQNGYVYYLDCLRWGIGWPLLILCLVSIIHILCNKRELSLLLLGYPLLYYIYMGSARLQFERFTLPLIPFLVIIVSCFIGDLKVRYGYSINRIISLVLIIGLIPMIYSVRSDYLLTKTDTRTLALNWINSHIPSGSKIALDGYGPMIYKAHPKLIEFTKHMTRKLKYNVHYLGRFGLGLYSLHDYQIQHFQYLISSNFTYERYFAQSRPYPKEVTFYKDLDSKTRLIKTFSPYKDNENPPFRLSNILGPSEYLFQLERPGPLLKIYAIDTLKTR